MVQFEFQDVIQALKSPTSIDEPLSNFSRCQLLENRARWLGFQSFHHLRKSLRHLPSDVFANVSLGLMRRICENKLPSQKGAYFEFVKLPKGVGYYSHWIGWDKHGDEVRVPRPLSGIDSVPRLRKALGAPVYVIENVRELAAWQEVWGATAYIPKELAKRCFPRQFDKRHLVEQDPLIDLVRARSDPYADNIAGDPSE